MYVLVCVSGLFFLLLAGRSPLPLLDDCGKGTVYYEVCCWRWGPFARETQTHEETSYTTQMRLRRLFVAVTPHQVFVLPVGILQRLRPFRRHPAGTPRGLACRLDFVPRASRKVARRRICGLRRPFEQPLGSPVGPDTRCVSLLPSLTAETLNTATQY